MERGELLLKVEQIAYRAAAEIMRVYQDGNLATETKADNTPVTRADKIANDVVLGGLGEISRFPIVSEENTIRKAGSAFWLVDPLDGTKEFIKGGSDFTVNIALIENGNPTLGVVCAPVHNVLYSGDAQANQSNKQEGERRQSIISEADADQPIVVVSKWHHNQKTSQFLDELGAHIERSIGSSLKLCLVAEGKAMLYPRLGPTSLWDTAAGDAIVRAAGGSVTNLEGAALSYTLKDTMLNPSFVATAKNNVLKWKA